MVEPVVTQRHRTAKRIVLGSVAPLAFRWAMSGEPSKLKSTTLRRIVLPGVAASGRTHERQFDGFRFAYDSHDLIGLYVHLFGTWEPNLTAFLRSRLASGGTFVDVGANLGWFTLLAAHQVGPTGHVVSIEASRYIADRLEANIARNRFENVRVVVAAVGRAAGEVEIELGPAEHMGTTKVHAVDASSTSTAERVRCDVLTRLLTDEETRTARVVKIDVEGAEYDVVAGLGPELDRFSDQCEFVVEVGTQRASQAEAAQLMATFTDRGYTPYELPNEYDIGNYRITPPVTRLLRINGTPARQTDVVFSRVDAPHLDL